MHPFLALLVANVPQPADAPGALDLRGAARLNLGGRPSAYHGTKGGFTMRITRERLCSRGRLACLAVSIAAGATLLAQPPAQAPPPLIKENATVKVSEHVWVIPDGNVQAVPNVGIIVGGCRDRGRPGRRGFYAAPGRSSVQGAMRPVRAMIWVATLFFLVMLFMPLVREAMRRASEGSVSAPF